MTREKLKAYLDNDLLKEAIRAKQRIEADRLRHFDAAKVCRDMGLGDASDALWAKVAALRKAAHGYGLLIGDVWGVNLRDEAIIAKYIDLDAEEVDDLPEVIKGEGA